MLLVCGRRGLMCYLEKKPKKKTSAAVETPEQKNTTMSGAKPERKWQVKQKGERLRLGLSFHVERKYS